MPRVPKMWKLSVGRCVAETGRQRKRSPRAGAGSCSTDSLDCGPGSRPSPPNREPAPGSHVKTGCQVTQRAGKLMTIRCRRRHPMLYFPHITDTETETRVLARAQHESLKPADQMKVDFRPPSVPYNWRARRSTPSSARLSRHYFLSESPTGPRTGEAGPEYRDTSPSTNGVSRRLTNNSLSILSHLARPAHSSDGGHTVNVESPSEGRRQGIRTGSRNLIGIAAQGSRRI